MRKQLYVANLSDSISEASLRELFSQYGRVNSIRLPTDRQTGQPCGYGFIEMATPAAARAARESLDGFRFQGRKLRVDEARPKD